MPLQRVMPALMPFGVRGAFPSRDAPPPTEVPLEADGAAAEADEDDPPEGAAAPDDASPEETGEAAADGVEAEPDGAVPDAWAGLARADPR